MFLPGPEPALGCPELYDPASIPSGKEHEIYIEQEAWWFPRNGVEVLEIPISDRLACRTA
jgi:hypothetical protein